VNSVPTSTGYYFGERMDMPQTEIEALAHEIELIAGCDGDLVDEEAQTVAASGDDKPAKAAGH
jgi:hypothetical protein